MISCGRFFVDKFNYVLKVDTSHLFFIKTMEENGLKKPLKRL